MTLALVACAGCFTDYAPKITGDPDDSSSSTGGGESTSQGTTGTDAGESTDTSAADPLQDSHGADASSSDTGTTAATTIVLPDTTGAPEDPYDQCLAQVGNDECGACLCDKCLDEYAACAADRGCVEIQACALDNNCSGAECLGPCGDVIEMNGGIVGESTQLAIALSDCRNNNCCTP